ncbi:MAG: hypothetical protein R3F61_03135 [Myxococcota bacterium]
MRAVMVAAVAVLATGCARVETTFSDTVSSEGVFVFQGTTDRGTIRYDGGGIGETFDVRGTSWATGGGKAKAERREADNQYAVSVQDRVLVASGVSFDGRAGVDFSVLGPSVMDVDILTDRGTAELFDVNGIHVVTANRVYGRGIIGDVDFFADSNGIDVEVLPFEFGSVRVESRSGDVDLYIPWGLDYDLTVVGDPEYEMVIEDLGFDTFVLEPGLAIGWRGGRSIRVDVVVTGGDVRVLSAF